MLDKVEAAHVAKGAPKSSRRRPRKSHLFVMLGSLAAGSAGTVTLLDSWQKVLEDLGLRKSEAFVLAEQNAEGDLVRQMTRLVSLRLFWIARYSGDVADGFPHDDQEEAWKQYNASVITWNENYMINVTLTEKYFGTATMNQLTDINWLMHQMNTCLNKIHYRPLYEAKDPACHFGAGTRHARAECCCFGTKQRIRWTRRLEPSSSHCRSRCNQSQSPRGTTVNAHAPPRRRMIAAPIAPRPKLIAMPASDSSTSAANMRGISSR